MSRLLDQRRIDEAMNFVRERTKLTTDLVRGIMYSEGERSAPPGMDNLDDHEKVSTFTRYLQRQAAREQSDAVAGNLNQTVASHPAVQQMAIDSGEAQSA